MSLAHAIDCGFDAVEDAIEVDVDIWRPLAEISNFTGRMDGGMPALLTRMSMTPALVRARSTESASQTSNGVAWRAVRFRQPLRPHVRARGR